MHELDFTTGNAAIAIAHDGDVPWHGYGQRVPKDGSIDQWRIAAGLNWDVDNRKVYYSVKDEGKNIPTVIGNRKALVRSDTQDVLSVVSDRYKEVQPKEVLDLYKDLAESHGFQIETAGALKGGQRIWALAKAPNSLRLRGQDEVGGYLLLATSYDGSMATIGKFTTVRVVCNNTLEFAVGGAEGKYDIRLPHTQEFEAEALKHELGLYPESWAVFQDGADKMAHKMVDLDTATEFYKSVLGDEAFLYDKESDTFTYSTKMQKMFQCFTSGRGADLRSSHRTAWGLVNSVTEYQDHLARSANAGNRVNSAWFGDGAKKKQRAWEAALRISA